MAQASSKRSIVNRSERPQNRRQPEFPLSKPKRERHALDVEEEEELSVRTHPAGGEGVKHPDEHEDDDLPTSIRRTDQ